MRTSIITNKSEIENIISQCDICFVGMTQEDGTPYVIPMNFGYANDQIILHSANEGKNIELLKKNNHVCVTFCTERTLKYQHPDVACSYSMTSKSVVCQGTVTFLEDLEEKTTALNLFMKNYSPRNFEYTTPALKNVKVWIVSIDQMTAKSFGQNFK